MSNNEDIQRLLRMVMKEWFISDDELEFLKQLKPHMFDRSISLCSREQLIELSSDLIKIIRGLRLVVIKIVSSTEGKHVELAEELSRIEKELQ